MPYPYSDCISDDDIAKSKSEFLQLILKTGYTYRKTDCFLLCFNKYISNVCKCQDLSAITLLENIVPCVNLSQQYCSGTEFAKFFISNMEAKCADQCPLECSETEFGLTLSSSKYPTDS